MKKLIGFLIVAAVLGCNCLSQIPTQTIYAGASCEALLPNYTQIVSVSDNCQVATFTQTPPAGTLLSTSNPQVNVLLRVTDVSGNISERNFNVVLLDTIKPIFNFPAEMMGYNPEQVKNMFLVVETALQEQMLDMMYMIPWDTVILGLPYDTVKTFNYNVRVTDEMWEAYINR